MMKKYLLGTAAAVACLGLATGAQADSGKINLSLGGYYNGMVAFTDVDMDDRSYKFGSDSEVHFKGKTTLDNGLTVGFKAELELENDGKAKGASADTIDEMYMYFKGGFGMIEFGQQDGVGDHFRVNTTQALKELGANDNNQEVTGLADIVTTNESSTDYTKITYITPAFSGLKIGLSFTPKATRNSQGFTPATEGLGDEIVEFGGIYKRKADDVDFSMSATYVLADDAGAIDAGNGQSFDLKEWNVGAKVATQGFSVGGAYRVSEGFGNREQGMGDHEYTAWVGGVSYETGPWLVSAEYAAHESEDSLGTQLVDGATTFVAARYKLSKGVQFGAGIQFTDDELADEDGTAFVIETALKF